MKPDLTIDIIKREATTFAEAESTYNEPNLYGVTDGKAVGTYLEHKFTSYLTDQYQYPAGNAASGIDIPSLKVDIKVTSVKQPQSSCPFKSARQKIYGLGYHLLVFVYEKYDDHEQRTGRLNMQHTIFVDQSRTGDYQMTRGLRQLLENEANSEDLIAFMKDRNLPVDDIEANNLAEALMDKMPLQGYITISNALQWRLQYSRTIQSADTVPGIERLR